MKVPVGMLYVDRRVGLPRRSIRAVQAVALFGRKQDEALPTEPLEEETIGAVAVKRIGNSKALLAHEKNHHGR